MDQILNEDPQEEPFKPSESRSSAQNFRMPKSFQQEIRCWAFWMDFSEDCFPAFNPGLCILICHTDLAGGLTQSPETVGCRAGVLVEGADDRNHVVESVAQGESPGWKQGL